jgi:hypothetical protein
MQTAFFRDHVRYANLVITSGISTSNSKIHLHRFEFSYSNTQVMAFKVLTVNDLGYDTKNNFLYIKPSVAPLTDYRKLLMQFI